MDNFPLRLENLLLPQICLGKYLLIMISIIYFLYCFFYSISIFLNKYKFIKEAYTLRKLIKNNNIIDSVRLIERNPKIINLQFKSDGYTPFLEACKEGRTFLVRLMVRRGADLSITTLRGESPFYLACYNLIEHGEYKDASCIHFLYHSGADINARTKSNYSPIQLAAAFGHTSLVWWLLQKNVNINVVPSPYQLAINFGHVKTSFALRNQIS